MNILFTVPHSVCINENTRDCDLLAYKAYTYMIKYIPYAKFVISDMPRVSLDLNRSQSINSSFHEKYINILKKFNNNGLLMDIHSFPNDPYLSTYNLDFYIIVEEGNDNTKILDMFKTSGDFIDTDINFKLSNNYNINTDYSKYFRYKILQGYNNFIIEEAKKYGIDSFIVEFNESLNNEKLDNICNYISNMILKYYNY